MRRTTSTALILILLTLPAVTGCGGGGGAEDGDPSSALVLRNVPAGLAVAVQQVDFLYPQGDHLDSTWGRLLIDPDLLQSVTGIQGGFLNVARGTSWVVVNLPVLSASEGPYAVYFDLGLAQRTKLDELALHVLHSDRGLGGLAEHLDQEAVFAVDRWPFAAEQDVPVLDPGIPPPMLSVASRVTVPREVTVRTQMVTNVQCAHNQCMTMAVANAVQYVEDMTVFDEPYPHEPGEFGDETLVGQLDRFSARGGTSRTSGSGLGVTSMVDGTFEHLWEESLTGILEFRHENDGVGWTILGTGTGHHVEHGSMSWDDGDTVTFDYLYDRIGDGSGVVAVYQRDTGGGHAGRITAAGFDDTGRQWVRFSHDSLQTNRDASDSRGLEDWIVDLDDTDGDGYPNFGSAGRELQFVWAIRPP
jgi:hypothetical protein